MRVKTRANILGLTAEEDMHMCPSKYYKCM